MYKLVNLIKFYLSFYIPTFNKTPQLTYVIKFILCYKIHHLK